MEGDGDRSFTFQSSPSKATLLPPDLPCSVEWELIPQGNIISLLPSHIQPITGSSRRLTGGRRLLLHTLPMLPKHHLLAIATPSFISAPIKRPIFHDSFLRGECSILPPFLQPRDGNSFRLMGSLLPPPLLFTLLFLLTTFTRAPPFNCSSTKPSKIHLE